MARTLFPSGWLALVVFAAAWLPQATTTAEGADRTLRSSSGVSSGGVSVQVGSSSRHRLHDRGSIQQRQRLTPQLRIQQRRQPAQTRRSHEFGYGHSFHRPRPGYHFDYAPQRRLHQDHYRRQRIAPPGSRVYIYGWPGVTYDYRYYSHRSSIPPRLRDDRWWYDDYHYFQHSPYRPPNAYRGYDGRLDPRWNTPRRPTYHYPYLDEQGHAGADAAAAAAMPDLGSGWDLLRTGNAADARNVFAMAVADTPRYAEAHLGYSLAMAASGEHQEAVRALRRALTLDPSVATGVVPDRNLDRQLETLLSDYNPTPTGAGIDAADGNLMQAVLHAMRGDITAARQAAEMAGDDGAAMALRGYLQR